MTIEQAKHQAILEVKAMWRVSNKSERMAARPYVYALLRVFDGVMGVRANLVSFRRTLHRPIHGL